MVPKREEAVDDPGSHGRDVERVDRGAVADAVIGDALIRLTEELTPPLGQEEREQNGAKGPRPRQASPARTQALGKCFDGEHLGMGDTGLEPVTSCMPSIAGKSWLSVNNAIIRHLRECPITAKPVKYPQTHPQKCSQKCSRPLQVDRLPDEQRPR